ncbi:MAG TPA: hypothetical protein VEL07_11735 [Planctomycetota bacterium]|nr:hypothetical protein [Planctomycetota bacterium]
MISRFAVVSGALCLSITAAGAATSAVGDPEIKTDHPYYQGELAYSTVDNLVASALNTPGRPSTGDPVKDTILRLYYWRLEHYYHRMSPEEYNLPGVVPNPANNNPLMIDYDCLSQQFSYGWGLCGTNHATIRPILEAANLPTRRRGINGDTTHEVYANGRWVMMNTDSASVISMSNSTTAEFAGVDDLIANKNLMIANPLGLPQYAFGSQVSGAQGTHSQDWYYYYDTGFDLSVAAASRMYAEGYQARPISYVLKRGETFTRFADRDGLPTHLGAPGAYRWWGYVGAGGPFRDWSYVGTATAPALNPPPTSRALANTRFGNGIFTWTPSLSAGDADDAVVTKDPAIVYATTSPQLASSSGTATITLSFFSPYTIAAVPSNGADPALPGATGGAWIVPTAVGSVPFEISVNNGASWTGAGTLSGTTPLDFTDLVKGRHAYLMRFTVGTASGLDGFTLRTCVGVSAAVFPTLKDGGSVVTYNAGQRGVIEQNPDFSSLANADAFKVADSGNATFTPLTASNTFAYRSTNNQPMSLTYRLAAPAGTKLKLIHAAADVGSRNPVPAGAYARLQYSTNGGGSFATFADYTPAADNELSHGWVYGSADVSGADVDEVLIRLVTYNGGYTASVRFVRLYGEHGTGTPGQLTIVHGWDDATAAGRTFTHVVPAGTSSTSYTVPTAGAAVSRSVSFSVPASIGGGGTTGSGTTGTTGTGTTGTSGATGTTGSGTSGTTGTSGSGTSGTTGTASTGTAGGGGSGSSAGTGDVGCGRGGGVAAAIGVALMLALGLRRGRG